MRKLMIIVMFSFIGNILFAQTPNTVKEKFTGKYPKATSVYWTNEKNNMYKVNYTENEVKHALVYDKDGNVMREEAVIQASTVPSNIIEYYKKRGVENSEGMTNYTVWEVKDKDGNVTYTTEYNGKTAYFDKNGNATIQKGMAEGEQKEPYDK